MLNIENNDVKLGAIPPSSTLMDSKESAPVDWVKHLIDLLAQEEQSSLGPSANPVIAHWNFVASLFPLLQAIGILKAGDISGITYDNFKDFVDESNKLHALADLTKETKEHPEKITQFIYGCVYYLASNEKPGSIEDILRHSSFEHKPLSAEQNREFRLKNAYEILACSLPSEQRNNFSVPREFGVQNQWTQGFHYSSSDSYFDSLLKECKEDSVDSLYDLFIGKKSEQYPGFKDFSRPNGIGFAILLKVNGRSINFPAGIAQGTDKNPKECFAKILEFIDQTGAATNLKTKLMLIDWILKVQYSSRDLLLNTLTTYILYSDNPYEIANDSAGDVVKCEICFENGNLQANMSKNFILHDKNFGYSTRERSTELLPIYNASVTSTAVINLTSANLSSTDVTATLNVNQPSLALEKDKNLAKHISKLGWSGNGFSSVSFDHFHDEKAFAFLAGKFSYFSQDLGYLIYLSPRISSEELKKLSKKFFEKYILISVSPLKFKREFFNFLLSKFTRDEVDDFYNNNLSLEVKKNDATNLVKYDNVFLTKDGNLPTDASEFKPGAIYIAQVSEKKVEARWALGSEILKQTFNKNDATILTTFEFPNDNNYVELSLNKEDLDEILLATQAEAPRKTDENPKKQIENTHDSDVVDLFSDYYKGLEINDTSRIEVRLSKLQSVKETPEIQQEIDRCKECLLYCTLRPYTNENIIREIFSELKNGRSAKFIDVMDEALKKPDVNKRKIFNILTYIQPKFSNNQNKEVKSERNDLLSEIAEKTAALLGQIKYKTPTERDQRGTARFNKLNELVGEDKENVLNSQAHLDRQVNCLTFLILHGTFGLKEEENFLGNLVTSKYGASNSLRRQVADLIGVNLDKFLPAHYTETHFTNLTFKQVREEVLHQLKLNVLLDRFKSRNLNEFNQILEDLLISHKSLISEFCPKDIQTQKKWLLDKATEKLINNLQSNSEAKHSSAANSTDVSESKIEPHVLHQLLLNIIKKVELNFGNAPELKRLRNLLNTQTNTIAPLVDFVKKVLAWDTKDRAFRNKILPPTCFSSLFSAPQDTQALKFIREHLNSLRSQDPGLASLFQEHSPQPQQPLTFS